MQAEARIDGVGTDCFEGDGWALPSPTASKALSPPPAPLAIQNCAESTGATDGTQGGRGRGRGTRAGCGNGGHGAQKETNANLIPHQRAQNWAEALLSDIA